MIKIKTEVGNLMNVKVGHIVHGCNAQGVMGSGVALAVKNMYKGVYQNYADIHASTGLVLGEAYPVRAKAGLFIWNAITQGDYGVGTRQVSYDAVATCFKTVNEHILGTDNILVPAEVHIPLIGAARGGGNWEIIREIIEQTMEFPVTLWLPDSTVTTL